MPGGRGSLPKNTSAVCNAAFGSIIAATMPSFAFLYAPFALLLPLGLMAGGDGGVGDRLEETQTARQTSASDKRMTPLPLSDEAPAWSPLLGGIEPARGEQVRIERRVILRISPARGAVRSTLTNEASAPRPRTRIVERKMADCFDSAKLGAVADRGDVLLMFLRDRRTVAARLEKGCSPRDFYRGAYMERSEDGKLCVKRDRLMSRSGAKCQVESFRELVVQTVE